LRNITADPQSVQLATTAQSVRDREIQGPAQLGPGSIVTHHVGLTLVQSISDRLVVATTMRGVLATAGVLIGAEELGQKTSGSFDLDAGAMAMFGPARIGVVVRNLRAPAFAAAANTPGVAPRTFEFQRQARVGVALMPDQGRRPNPTTIALDVDLTTQHGLTSSSSGGRRNVAVGMEQWLMNRRVGLRGGVRASTLGDARPIVAGGASVMVRSSIFVDAHVSGGRADDTRGWGLSARVSF